jgi:hypothetical protein
MWAIGFAQRLSKNTLLMDGGCAVLNTHSDLTSAYKKRHEPVSNRNSCFDFFRISGAAHLLREAVCALGGGVPRGFTR